MAADERCLGDEVRRGDRLGPEPQMRNRHGSGLLRVIDEVALRPELRLLADDLDRVLIRADGAVGAEAEEHRTHRSLRLDAE